MSEKSEALIGLIDDYLAKKNHLPANAIKEELKRVKVLEMALGGLMASICGGEKHCGHKFTCICAGDAARKALGENHE